MPYADIERQRDANRQRYYRARGLQVATATPPGYIDVWEAAQRLGYTQRGLTARIVRGWAAGQVWQRGRRGKRYIREEFVNGELAARAAAAYARPGAARAGGDRR